MSVVNHTNEGENVITGKDSVVIVKVTHTIRGGRALDVTGFSPLQINAGHPIIMESSTKTYKPMPVVGTGAIEALGSITPGSSYTNGTYTGVALTGGAGSGATANITVAGGAVTNVIIVNKGTGYVDGNSLSASAASIGGTGSGFAVPVTVINTVAANYGTLPNGHIYAGILIGSILTKKAAAGIMVGGTVNPAAAPFSMTGILSAVKTALPLIDFRED